MKSAINWFEIPVDDFERAEQFYNSILEHSLSRFEGIPDCQMSVFHCEGEGATGAIVKDGRKPCSDGTMIYINGGNDLSAILEKVEPAGGKILTPKTLIAENIGYYAAFLDTEGNRIGLHSAG